MENREEYELSVVRDLLLEGYTAETLRRFLLYSEHPKFRVLCDEIGPGDGLAGIVEKVIVHAKRQGLLDELLARVAEDNPGQYVRFADRLPRLAAQGVCTSTGVSDLDILQAPDPLRTIALWNDPHKVIPRRAEESSSELVSKRDAESFRDYRKLFDRAAFRTPCIFEVTLTRLEDAVDDTLAAMATGALYSRKNRIGELWDLFRNVRDTPAEFVRPDYASSQRVFLLKITPKSDFQTEPYCSRLDELTGLLWNVGRLSIKLRNLLKALHREYLHQDLPEDYCMDTVIAYLIWADTPHESIRSALKLMDNVDVVRNMAIELMNGLLEAVGGRPLPSIPLSTERIVKSAEPTVRGDWNQFFVSQYAEILPILTESVEA